MVAKIKMAKWLPPPPSTKMFGVKLKSFMLEDIENIFEWKTHVDQIVSLKVKWKGGERHTFWKQRCPEDLSNGKMLQKGLSCVIWDDDEEEFENICCLTLDTSSHDHHKHHQFAPWFISFHVLLGDSKVKPTVIGKGSVNVSEMAAETESGVIQRRVPITFRRNHKEASLIVNLTIEELKEGSDSVRTGQEPAESMTRVSNKKRITKQPSQEHVCWDEPETSSANRFDLSPVYPNRSKKTSGWFTWKRNRASLKPVQSKDEPVIKKTRSWNFGNIVDSVLNQHNVGESNEEDDQTSCAWKSTDLISRDGQTKLKSDVYFASFDQRSDKAAGESACTALVAVVAHWLLSNAENATPRRPVFDDLIIQGSSEWRNLCDDTKYRDDFPNKHFDLETILRAGVRPIAISHDESFIAFFNPERFGSLSGAMSFDELWQKIVAFDENRHERVYIISWNDHFFVLKIDRDAYYIIDTLGERLYEGCEKAYVLRFDDSSLMLQKGKCDDDGKECDEKIICGGKECCKEFIVRFLAGIALEELEEQEKKETVSYFSLHQRLQIEFHLTYLLSSPTSPSSSSSSLNSSPFSSSSVSSPFHL